MVWKFRKLKKKRKKMSLELVNENFWSNFFLWLKSMHAVINIQVKDMRWNRLFKSDLSWLLRSYLVKHAQKLSPYKAPLFLRQDWSNTLHMKQSISRSQPCAPTLIKPMPGISYNQKRHTLISFIPENLILRF